MKQVKRGIRQSARKRVKNTGRSKELQKKDVLLHASLDVNHASSGRQLLVFAVAIAMLISVVGTFVVLQELSHAEELVESVRAHQVLNAMVVKQMAEEEGDEQEVLSEYYQEDGGEHGKSVQ